MITSKKCLKIPPKCKAVRTHFAIRAKKKSFQKPIMTSETTV